MVKNIIETFDLSKVYKLKSKKKEITVLNKVNISVKEGEIYGLLGPNGAGKTTLIQVLTTLQQPTSGYAIIDGYNISKNPIKVQNNIALMLGSKMLYNRIKAYDNLKYFCKIYNISNYKKKIYDMTKEFGLKKWLNEYVENFSSGMKMKLALCRTFLLERSILFLDEPTLGVDVESLSFIVDKIKNSKSTIFLTSHDMNVVEKLCDQIAFINQGKIVMAESKDKLKDLMKLEIKIEIFVNNDKIKLKNELNTHDFITEINEFSRGLLIKLKKRTFYPSLLNILSIFKVLKVKEIDLTIEDLFLKIIKKKS